MGTLYNSHLFCSFLFSGCFITGKNVPIESIIVYLNDIDVRTLSLTSYKFLHKQVMLLLYVAHVIIHAMWRFKIDPDNSAIPYLTALGDLSGSVLLCAAMYFLLSINHQYGEY